jgi:hypothetical protein
MNIYLSIAATGTVFVQNAKGLKNDLFNGAIKRAKIGGDTRGQYYKSRFYSKLNKRNI